MARGHCACCLLWYDEPVSYDYLLCDSISFTAARDMDETGRDSVVTYRLAALPSVGRYVTGGARGGDSFIGQWLLATRPDAEHVVVVPANRSQVDPWWLAYPAGAVTVIEMPPGTTYADRNARLVEESDAVVGFPAYPEKDKQSLRSGTWQAIRMADRAENLSQWYCVNPPFEHRVLKYIETRSQL